MAELLVCDTSVLIDLQRGGILDTIFGLAFDIGAPDVLYERELRHWDGPSLEGLGLKILVLDAPGVELAQTYRTKDHRLSVPDAFALALAKRGGHVLLAGDGSVRNLASTEDVECHGVLWVLDALDEHGILGPEQLLNALDRIARHPRCRLPTNEVRRRLERYRRAMGSNSGDE